jgi:hypothetical protein
MAEERPAADGAGLLGRVRYPQCVLSFVAERQNTLSTEPQHSARARSLGDDRPSFVGLALNRDLKGAHDSPRAGRGASVTQVAYGGQPSHAATGSQLSHPHALRTGIAPARISEPWVQAIAVLLGSLGDTRVSPNLGRVLSWPSS